MENLSINALHSSGKWLVVLLMAKFLYGRVRQTKVTGFHGLDLTSAGVSCAKEQGQASCT